MLRGNLERLLNGPTLDSPEPERSSDAASRLRIAQAVRRAEFAIAWERSWPHLARFLTVVGLFLVLSWAGLWLVLPFVARAVGLGLFLAVALAALFPLSRFRWPSRQDALTRLVKGRTLIAIAHRLSSLSTYDRIVVLERGRIVEDGTVSELRRGNGAYQKMLALQRDVTGRG